MDAATPHIPSPSMAWSRVASTHGGELPLGATPAAKSPPAARREEEAAQLKARLLRLIVDNEKSRKAAAVEAANAPR